MAVINEEDMINVRGKNYVSVKEIEKELLLNEIGLDDWELINGSCR